MRTEISRFRDLWKLRNSSEGDEFVLTNDIIFGFNYTPDFVEKFITNWLFPIDDFNGVLDGDGHTIYSFRCEGMEESSLIKNNNGVIKNLELDNVKIIAGDKAAGLALSNNGKIKNCFVRGKVKSEWDGDDLSTIGDKESAGLALSNNGKIKNCSVSCLIEGSLMSSGLVGVNEGDVVDCDFDGCINFSDFIGGIVGDNYGLVKNCHSSGSVNTGGTCGGIAFNNDGDNAVIENCWSDVTLNGGCGETTISDRSIGGLVGSNRERSTVRDSYFVGALIGEGRKGMIIGKNNGVCRNCYYMGSHDGFGFKGDNVENVGHKESIEEIKDSILVGKI